MSSSVSGARRALLVSLMSIALLGVISLSGCMLSNSSESFSDSSNSISDSLSNSSDSSSGSSSGQDSAYIDTIRDYTVAHLRAGGGSDALVAGLGRVAASRGVTDWESLMATFEGIGAGLAEAGSSEARFAEYEERLAGSDPERRLALLRGFSSGRR